MNSKRHNIYITNLFDGWLPKLPSSAMRSANKFLNKFQSPANILPPVRTGSMTSVEQRINLYHLLNSVFAYDIPGEIVELGCHSGQSAALFQRINQEFGYRKELHVYDSFQGPPAANQRTEGSPPEGSMTAIQQQLIDNFRKLDLRQPIIHPGWFSDTLPDGLPEQIAFAHLDGNLYESTKISLESVYWRMTRGAICVIDDFADTSLFRSVDFFPGVKKACDEFFEDKKETPTLLYGGYDSSAGYGSHAYFRKEE